MDIPSWVIVIAIVYRFIIGGLVSDIAVRKHYPTTYFWIGFLLGIVGLQYVGFLPMHDVRYVMPKKESIDV